MTWGETEIAWILGGSSSSRVTGGKNYSKCMTEIQGKLILVRVTTGFELS